MTDGPFGSNLKSSDYIPSGVRVIRLGNIGVGEFKDDDRSFVSEEKFASLTKHEACAGDLVIAALAEPVGRACIVPDTIGPALVKADCVRARITPEVGAMLVMRWMNSPEGLRSAALASHGIGRLRINLGEMRALPVPLPPAPEQRRIVAKLDAVFAQTRAAKARLERLPALIEKLKRSVLAAAFRGDLTADWRAANPDVEPASELLARFEAARSRVSNSRDGRRRSHGLSANEDTVAPEASRPDLPRGWVSATLQDVSLSISYGHTASADFNSTGPRFLRITDIDKDGHVDWESVPRCVCDDPDRYQLKNGDIAVARTGATTGKSYLATKISETTVFASYLIKLSMLDMDTGTLVSHFMNSATYWSQISERNQGTAQGGVNATLLASIEMPLPPREEGKEISKALESTFRVLEQLTSHTHTLHERWERLERSALAKAFRGELVPQDPADEPAEVLLERIRTAKAEEAPVVRRPRAAAAPTYAAPVTLAQAAESGPLFKHALDRQARAATEPAALDLVIAALQQSDGRLTAAAIAQATGLDLAAIRAPLKELVAAGQVRTHGKARGTTYEWTQ